MGQYLPNTFKHRNVRIEDHAFQNRVMAGVFGILMLSVCLIAYLDGGM